MISEISILMPCRDNECYDLVADISAQAESLIRSGRPLRYEIIVADDGSTSQAVISRNRRIDALPECTYIVRGRNVGRAAIRNFLARTASYGWLLFMDSDLKVRSGSFLKNYLDADAPETAYGGYTISGDAGKLRGNLRYRYETRYSRNASAEERRKRPYDMFHMSNFAIRRDIMLAHPLDERVTRYGHEDLLFGKTLKKAGVSVTHIDNPLSFEDFETNASFMAKTEESVIMLNELRDELRGYSAVIAAADKLGRMRLMPLAAALFRILAKPIKNNLTGNNPSVLLFNMYKLGMFCSLENSKTRRQKPQNAS